MHSNTLPENHNLLPSSDIVQLFSLLCSCDRLGLLLYRFQNLTTHAADNISCISAAHTSSFLLSYKRSIMVCLWKNLSSPAEFCLAHGAVYNLVSAAFSLTCSQIYILIHSLSLGMSEWLCLLILCLLASLTCVSDQTFCCTQSFFLTTPESHLCPNAPMAIFLVL